MKVIRYFINRYRSKLFWFVLASLVANLVSAGSVFILLKIVNGFDQSIEHQLLLTLVIKYILCSILTTTLMQWYDSKKRIVNADLRKHLEIKVFSRLSYLPWPQFNKMNRGELVSLFKMDIQRLSYILTIISDLFTQLFFIILFSIIACYLSWPLTAIAGSIGTFMLVLSYFYNKKVYSLGVQLSNSYKKLDSGFEEKISNMPLSHVLNLHEKNIKELAGASEDICAQTLSFSKLLRRVRFSNLILSSLGAIVLLYMGYNSLGVKLPEIVVLAVIYYQLMQRVESFHSSYASLKHLQVSFESLKKYMDESDTCNPPANNKEVIKIGGEIKLDKICFQYSSKGPYVLSHLDMELRVGELTLISGASGVGKSTLINILCGMLKKTKGNIFVDGKEIKIYNNPLWRDKIGFVPQEHFFSHRSILENIRYAKPDCSEEEAYRALEKANIKARVLALPDKINSVMGYRGNFLSGGEKQRVALARAIVNEPKLLLLDEASSALDEFAQEEFINVLQRLKKDMAIVLVTHQKYFLKYADQHVHFKRGMMTTEKERELISY